MEAKAISYVRVDGDPGCVYPGITTDILMNDPCAISKFFPEACATQMAAYTREMLDGKQSGPFELHIPLKSAPGAKHDLCVVVTVEEVLRYTNSDKNTTCLNVGHTTDVTSLIRVYDGQLRNMPGSEQPEGLLPSARASRVRSHPKRFLDDAGTVITSKRAKSESAFNNWVSCDECNKWRRVAQEPTVDKWYCGDNLDADCRAQRMQRTTRDVRRSHRQ